jgi:hypothetical protein
LVCTQQHPFVSSAALTCRHPNGKTSDRTGLDEI